MLFKLAVKNCQIKMTFWKVNSLLKRVMMKTGMMNTNMMEKALLNCQKKKCAWWMQKLVKLKLPDCST